MRTISVCVLVAIVGIGSSGCREGSPGGGRDIAPPAPVGSFITVKTPILVKSGETFNGKGERYRAGKALGDGSQREGQLPLFRLQSGATLQNLRIIAPAADGVHVRLDSGTGGAVQVENVHWDDVGEDALTVKSGSGEVILKRCSFRDAADKTIQLSDHTRATVRLYGCKFKRVQKALRSGNADVRQRFEMKNGSITDADYGVMLRNRKARAIFDNVEFKNVRQKASARPGQVEFK